MSNVRIAFHSPNSVLRETLKRFSQGLNGHRSRFLDKLNNDGLDVNFFFGSIVGNSMEVRSGMNTLASARQNLSVLGRPIPMAIVVDANGCSVWSPDALEPNAIRMLIRVGAQNPFPKTGHLIRSDAIRIDVSDLRWTEDELDRVRTGLSTAVNAFRWGGM